MKIINTIIYSAIAVIIAAGCNNQTKNQTGQTSTNYDTAIQEVNTGDTASERLNTTDTSGVTADTVSQQTATEKETYSFQKSLQFKNLSFDVYTKGEGSLRNLSIKSNGLSETNQNVDLKIDGKVTDAQVADLNADGFPELLIFTQSAGSGSYGNVIAYSVNKGKSMSRINFPATSENPQLKKGYMGHDSFSVNNSTLIQEFPIYKEGDANSNPTGGVRHVQYKLVNGEASRKFVVDKISETTSK